jgi:hypothetical protein
MPLMSESEFLARAAEFRRRANGTKIEADKRTWLMLAESWLLLLRIAERQQGTGQQREAPSLVAAAEYRAGGHLN